MKKAARFVFFLFLLSLFLYFSFGEKKADLRAEKLENFFRKKDVTIAITDSGLGGLSIMADAVERMKESRVFRKANFVFFNALFSNEGGYNSLKTREEKIRIFDSALQSLEKNYRPDLILVGCNTLSVLYNDTPFSRETAIPVVGIIEAGVELIAQNLEKSPGSRVIIFGTQTTVAEGTHKSKLEIRGISPERIVLQACPELVTYIEKGFASEETEMLIAGYVDEALQKIQRPESPLYVSLNCTHYGYSLDLWKKAFEAYGIKPAAFLNPNAKMTDFLFTSQRRNRFKSKEISTRAVSMVKISQETIESLGKWLKEVSPQMAMALSNYALKPGLFEWKKYVISWK